MCRIDNKQRPLLSTVASSTQLCYDVGEGLVNMEDNKNAEFKIFHCMQLLHHAYNHSFCQGYNHMYIHNQASIKNIIHFNILTISSIQVEDLITKRKCNTYITPKLVARSKCFRLLLIH